MLSFSSFVFSCRMRLSKLKHHKLAVSLSILTLLSAAILGPPLYEESWLDPFSTLGLSNREFHPHAITMLGMLYANDPYHPYYYTNQKEISAFIHDLQQATPITGSQIPKDLKEQSIEFFTLHRSSSKFHSEEDYALQYYPQKGIVRFESQLFQINDAAVNLLTQIVKDKTPGWWKS